MITYGTMVVVRSGFFAGCYGPVVDVSPGIWPFWPDRYMVRLTKPNPQGGLSPDIGHQFFDVSNLEVKP